MIIQAKCQHCNGEFEDEGLERTGFCPLCGKETRILPKGSNFAPKFTTDDPTGVIIVGYVCAILPIFDFAGFFFGIYLMAKKQHGHGVAVMALSIITAPIWLMILF